MIAVRDHGNGIYGREKEPRLPGRDIAPREASSPNCVISKSLQSSSSFQFSLKVGEIWSEWMFARTHQASPLGLQPFRIQPLEGGTRALLKWEPPTDIRGEGGIRALLNKTPPTYIRGENCDDDRNGNTEDSKNSWLGK